MTAPPDPGELLTELVAAARLLGPSVAPAGRDELLRSLTDTARALFGAGACSLALLSDDEEELEYVAASGAGAENVVGMRIGAAHGVAGFVMQSGQPVAISDLRRDARFARDVAEDTGYVPEAILAVPVSSPRGQLGVLTLLDRDAGRDGAAFDLRTASLFADQAALAIESARASSDVAGLLLDALTRAATTGPDLATVLQQATAARPGDELLAVAALLATLARRSPASARLAARVLQEFLTAADG